MVNESQESMHLRSGLQPLWASLIAQMVKNLPVTQETLVQSLGQKDTLEKEVETHSSILAWEIHGQRNLMGYSPWGHKELDMTEQVTLSFPALMG